MKKISKSRTSTPVKSEKAKPDATKKFFAIKNKIARLKKELAAEESKLTKTPIPVASKELKTAYKKKAKTAVSGKKKTVSKKTSTSKKEMQLSNDVASVKNDMIEKNNPKPLKRKQSAKNKSKHVRK